MTAGHPDNRQAPDRGRRGGHDTPVEPSGGLIEMAQFYDLLHRGFVTRRIHHLLDGLRSAVGVAPQLGVLDVGAGSGLMAQAFIHRFPGIAVTAVEPSPAMRVALWTTMAADPAMRNHVRVLPIPAQVLDVDGGHDLATCLWAVHGFSPQDRRHVWTRVRRALIPGGRLLIERPTGPHQGTWLIEEHEIARVSVGRDVVVMTGAWRSAGPQMEAWTFHYRLMDQQGTAIYESGYDGTSWHVDDAQLVYELKQAGFTIESIIADLTQSDQEPAGEVYIARC